MPGIKFISPEKRASKQKFKAAPAQKPFAFLSSDILEANFIKLKQFMNGKYGVKEGVSGNASIIPKSRLIQMELINSVINATKPVKRDNTDVVILSHLPKLLDFPKDMDNKPVRGAKRPFDFSAIPSKSNTAYVIVGDKLFYIDKKLEIINRVVLSKSQLWKLLFTVLEAPTFKSREEKQLFDKYIASRMRTDEFSPDNKQIDKFVDKVLEIAAVSPDRKDEFCKQVTNALKTNPLVPGHELDLYEKVISALGITSLEDEAKKQLQKHFFKIMRINPLSTINERAIYDEYSFAKFVANEPKNVDAKSGVEPVLTADKSNALYEKFIFEKCSHLTVPGTTSTNNAVVIESLSPKKIAEVSAYSGHDSNLSDATRSKIITGAMLYVRNEIEKTYAATKWLWNADNSVLFTSLNMAMHVAIGELNDFNKPKDFEAMDTTSKNEALLLFKNCILDKSKELTKLMADALSDPNMKLNVYEVANEVSKIVNMISDSALLAPRQPQKWAHWKDQIKDFRIDDADANKPVITTNLKTSSWKGLMSTFHIEATGAGEKTMTPMSEAGKFKHTIPVVEQAKHRQDITDPQHERMLSQTVITNPMHYMDEKGKVAYREYLQTPEGKLEEKEMEKERNPVKAAAPVAVAPIALPIPVAVKESVQVKDIAHHENSEQLMEKRHLRRPHG